MPLSRTYCSISLRVRIEDLDAALVAALDAIEQRERLVVQPAGVEREHLDLGHVARR